MKDKWYARTVFFVKDCESSLKFYRSLGFKENWRYNENGILVAVQVELKQVEIILNSHGGRTGNGRIFLSLKKGEVKNYLSTLKTKNINVKEGFWGMPVKVISDLDGNEILFFDEELSNPHQDKK